LILTEIDGNNRIEKIPALRVEKVIDTSGAGDSMLAAATLTLCATNDIYMAAYLGSLAAGIQVTRRGNLPLTENFWRDF
jgi:sugar/nucleoside kinase (ribokinase family)